LPDVKIPGKSSKRGGRKTTLANREKRRHPRNDALWKTISLLKERDTQRRGGDKEEERENWFFGGVRRRRVDHEVLRGENVVQTSSWEKSEWGGRLVNRVH